MFDAVKMMFILDAVAKLDWRDRFYSREKAQIRFARSSSIRSLDTPSVDFDLFMAHSIGYSWILPYVTGASASPLSLTVCSVRYSTRCVI